MVGSIVLCMRKQYWPSRTRCNPYLAVKRKSLLYSSTFLHAASCYPRNLRPVRDFMKIKSSALPLALLFTISAAAQTTSHFDGQTWWNHIKVLADDKLEGRDTGSRGEREAQAYAIEQFEKS